MISTTLHEIAKSRKVIVFSMARGAREPVRSVQAPVAASSRELVLELEPLERAWEQALPQSVPEQGRSAPGRAAASSPEPVQPSQALVPEPRLVAVLPALESEQEPRQQGPKRVAASSASGLALVPERVWVPPWVPEPGPVAASPASGSERGLRQRAPGRAAASSERGPVPGRALGQRVPVLPLLP